MGGELPNNILALVKTYNTIEYHQMEFGNILL
ncbi:MAG: hypothetical protein Edafosvirus13_10 [Edafosvirus sp.]|uniref:Uncharacterized protein n=1 Tax=Edafosvirus sp. TaxID=2487765 RepID=A0A3G4ZU82_9VIRU|nr:MAG: hypothetical protein Edafosvirus13_10 [Edafosvirus sp.]